MRHEWPPMPPREVHDWRMASVAAGVAGMGTWTLGWFPVAVVLFVVAAGFWAITAGRE